jgi:hypothetical protein
MAEGGKEEAGLTPAGLAGAYGSGFQVVPVALRQAA